ncbi:hypothetical protein Tco_1482061 [Tanacetum coccineum]
MISYSGEGRKKKRQPISWSRYPPNTTRRKKKPKSTNSNHKSGDSILMEPPTQTDQEQGFTDSLGNGITKVEIFLDSQLLVNQIKVEHVRRNQNKKADALSKLASMTFEHLTTEVLVEVLTKRSIEEKEVLKVDTQERKSWMDPIHEYLLSRLFPEYIKEDRKIRIQAP